MKSLTTGIGVAALIGQVAFPPFQVVGPRSTLNMGYGFILAPPVHQGQYPITATVDTSLLAIQLLVTLAVILLLRAIR